jgi:biotin-(acetyl-CoA carboxylase) ligase
LAVTQCPHDVLEITAAFCESLMQWYVKWHKEGFAPVRAALLPILAYQGRTVSVTCGEKSLEGAIQGLDERGRLLVQSPAGEVRALDAGEVALLRTT